ncbi:hypothetical protein [Domibacillus aminovorans]|uniref:Uncharacterized protein n=1 Tax=Domibacillus aminovorans TaxID=29332 RepID=A0A177LA92_9BACI|nr:hypothetical protein [Domibacillus aminovorans]OAH62316.1 hypothetical protein AWH49_10550 [Domibacillus aminovorans]
MKIHSKRYSWLSYTAFILGILLAASPVIHAQIVSFDLMLAFYIGIPIVVILSLIALLKRDEKKLLAFVGLILGLIMLGFVSLLLYIPGHKFSNVTYFISQM